MYEQTTFDDRGQIASVNPLAKGDVFVPRDQAEFDRLRDLGAAKSPADLAEDRRVEETRAAADTARAQVEEARAEREREAAERSPAAGREGEQARLRKVFEEQVGGGLTAGGHPAVVDLPPCFDGEWVRVTDLSGSSAQVLDERSRARALAARLGGENPPDVQLSGVEAELAQVEADEHSGEVGPVERARAQALAARLL